MSTLSVACQQRDFNANCLRPTSLRIRFSSLRKTLRIPPLASILPENLESNSPDHRKSPKRASDREPVGIARSTDWEDGDAARSEAPLAQELPGLKIAREEDIFGNLEISLDYCLDKALPECSSLRLTFGGKSESPGQDVSGPDQTTR